MTIERRQREPDPYVPFMRSIDELPDDISLSALKRACRYRIRRALGRPKTESVVVLRREQGFSESAVAERGDPLASVERGRVEQGWTFAAVALFLIRERVHSEVQKCRCLL